MTLTQVAAPIRTYADVATAEVFGISDSVFMKMEDGSAVQLDNGTISTPPDNQEVRGVGYTFNYYFIG